MTSTIHLRQEICIDVFDTEAGVGKYRIYYKPSGISESCTLDAEMYLVIKVFLYTVNTSYPEAPSVFLNTSIKYYSMLR